MFHAVVEHLVVHLVGKDHQTVLARNRHDCLEQFVGIQRAGRVVGVDHHDALGGRCDLAADVVQIGHPAIRLVAHVVHRRATREADRCRPQRVVGGGQQQLVAIVEQGIGGHHDQFAGTVAEVNVVQSDTLDALLLRLVHHRLACRKNPLAVRITSRVRQVADHVLLDLLGGIKAEHRQVADVQADDLVALFFHLARRIHDGTADVVADVGELGGFLDGFQSPSRLGAVERGGEPGYGAGRYITVRLLGKTCNLTTVLHRIRARSAPFLRPTFP